MSNKLINWTAWALIDGVAAPAAITTQRGLGTLVDTGVGDWSVTLDQGIDATLCACVMQPITTNLRQTTIVHTSDTVKQLLASTGAAGVDVAADTIFNVMFGGVYPVN